ncbi:MAG: NADH-quinone oxidoreductase subunit L [Pirellulaceae bacterium]|nr:NADH-quinone oxidoreductase subunit L [Pirellulaceae bacterium]
MAIFLSFALSLLALGIWVWETPNSENAASSETALVIQTVSDSYQQPFHAGNSKEVDSQPGYFLSGRYYTLFQTKHLWLGLEYYIDTLTLCMFCMITLIAGCIHLYASSYMEDELTDNYVDDSISPFYRLTRPGRYRRFFQYLSLFCFSMLGLILSGNLLQSFIFWELVGLCSYFLIGFYIERKKANQAASKAFLVNRVGDFGMLVGLAVLFAYFGTLSFATPSEQLSNPQTAGIFNQLKGRINPSTLVEEPPTQLPNDAEAASPALISYPSPSLPYWVLIVGGLGLFCGCIGKSAQFPLHIWLADAMEGPTPVSALVHSATMVAAGVYLLGRVFPILPSEALLIIALVGAVTLLLSATMALVATDIKRILAFSTISQLGYMIVAIGSGAWLGAMFHLITHAFFKSLLFMGAGATIHAAGTNHITEMGGLRKKCPYTAYSMLIGCLALCGVGIPFLIGFSGYYSKDKILEQVYTLGIASPWTGLLSWIPGLLWAAALGGTVLTGFYTFRMWLLAFTGQPKDHKTCAKAHDPSPMMYGPMFICAFFAITLGWSLPFSSFGLTSLLKEAAPVNAAHTALSSSTLTGEVVLRSSPEVAKEPLFTIESEPHHHLPSVTQPVILLATGGSLLGILLAFGCYYTYHLKPSEITQSIPFLYALFKEQYYLESIFRILFVTPILILGTFAKFVDRFIDFFLEKIISIYRAFANWWELFIDRLFVDGLLGLLAKGFLETGYSLRYFQTGSLRTYLLFLLGTVTTVLLILQILLT